MRTENPLAALRRGERVVSDGLVYASAPDQLIEPGAIVAAQMGDRFMIRTVRDYWSGEDAVVGTVEGHDLLAEACEVVLIVDTVQRPSEAIQTLIEAF